MLNDNISIKGKLKVTVVDTTTGMIKYDINIPNLVVTTGKELIAARLAGTSEDVIGWMAVGTDGTTAVAGDTTLVAEVARVATTVSGGTPNSNTVEYVAVYPAGTAIGSLEEAGLFNAGVSGTMLARTTYSVINKGAADEMTITWTITVG